MSALPLPAALADVLARGDVWRGDTLARLPDSAVPSGHAELDAELPGGGWPRGNLTEILVDRSGLGEMSLLLPALARLSAAGGWLALVAPPWLPHAPAWAAAGLALERLVVVRAGRQAAWCCEQLLACGGFAARAGLAGGQRIDARALRRLQVAAEGRPTLACLWRPHGAGGDAFAGALAGAAGGRRRAVVGAYSQAARPAGGAAAQFVDCPSREIARVLWLALHFPLLALEALPLRQSPSAGRQLAGGCWLCDRLAAEAGVSAGQKLSTALGLQPGLAVFERDAAREGSALESLACWAGRFTPTLSLAPPDGAAAGNRRLPAPVRRGGGDRRGGARRLRRAGVFHCAGRSRRRRSARAGWRRHAAGAIHQEAPAMQAALAALPCAVTGWPDEVVKRLESFGLKCLGDLRAVPGGRLAPADRQRAGR